MTTYTTYTAIIGTASDVVTGDHCDVSVVENEIIGFNEVSEYDPETGTETMTEVPEYGMSSTVAMAAVATNVRTDDDDKLGRIEADAEEILRENGWTVTGPWDLSDNAAYATVERDDDEVETVEKPAAVAVTAADVRDLLDSPAEEPVLYVKLDEDTGAVVGLDVWAAALVPATSVVIRRADMLDEIGDDAPDRGTIADYLPTLQDTVDSVVAEQH